MILFELLIALSLTAILVTLLFSFFVQNAKIERKLEIAEMEIAERGYMQTRLQGILSSIDQGSNAPYFYTELPDQETIPQLLAIFDNGIDPDPSFSGSIHLRLYLDKNKNLCLKTWPLGEEEEKKYRLEILCQKVDHIDMEFLGPRFSEEKDPRFKERPITTEVAWNRLWPKKNGQRLPGIIRLVIERHARLEKVRYAFLLPTFDPLITYAPYIEKQRAV